MGACDRRTQGAAIAALSPLPRTPRRVHSAFRRPVLGQPELRQSDEVDEEEDDAGFDSAGFDSVVFDSDGFESPPLSFFLP